MADVDRAGGVKGESPRGPFKYWDKGSMATIGRATGGGRDARLPLQRLPGVAGVAVHPHHVPGPVREPGAGAVPVVLELRDAQPHGPADHQSPRGPGLASRLRRSALLKPGYAHLLGASCHSMAGGFPRKLRRKHAHSSPDRPARDFFLVLTDPQLAQRLVPILTFIDCNDEPHATLFTAISIGYFKTCAEDCRRAIIRTTFPDTMQSPVAMD